MIELYDKKILIDGFSNSKIPIYKGTPPEIREELILNIPPYNDIDIALFTHDHSDHFDPESTAEFLKHNTNGVIISANKVIEKLKCGFPDLEDSRLIKSNPGLYHTEKINIKGINITACSLLHDGDQYKDVQNLAYIIDVYGKKIMHVGDAKTVEDNYINLNLLEKNIDLLIAPFPYVSIIKGRQVIEKYIKPRKVIAVHLPYKERDDFNWIESAKKSYMRVQKNFIDTVFFQDIGCEFYLEG